MHPHIVATNVLVGHIRGGHWRRNLWESKIDVGCYVRIILREYTTLLKMIVEFYLLWHYSTLCFNDGNKYFTSIISAFNESESASITLDSKSINTPEWSDLTRIYSCKLKSHSSMSIKYLEEFGLSRPCRRTLMIFSCFSWQSLLNALISFNTSSWAILPTNGRTSFSQNPTS